MINARTIPRAFLVGEADQGGRAQSRQRCMNMNVRQHESADWIGQCPAPANRIEGYVEAEDSFCSVLETDSAW